MADVTFSSYGALETEYAVFLPSGTVWIYDTLRYDAPRIVATNSVPHRAGALLIPVDLITAARLRLVRPGDDSGLTDEQWAWIRLIGLTGESA